MSKLPSTMPPPSRRLPTAGRRAARLLIAAEIFAAPLSAQVPEPLAAEREAFAEWLAQAALSPAAAVAMTRVNDRVTLGPATAQIPLAGITLLAVRPVGPGIRLDSAGTTRPIPRYRPVPVGPYSFYIGGRGARTTLTVYRKDSAAAGKAPVYYPYRPDRSETVTLDRDGAGRRVAMLALDGVEVEGFVAGHVTVPDGAGTVTLEVRHVPNPASDETDLQVYFRDATNDRGSYPAGRFVTLVPAGGDRYRLDFNTARNPFCAYSSVYPCPVPWPGNRLTSAVEAGERYLGGGVTPPAPEP